MHKNPAKNPKYTISSPFGVCACTENLLHCRQLL